MEQTLCKQIAEGGVTLSQREAEEYCAYKRQKKISEIMSAMQRSESVYEGLDDGEKTCQQSARLRQSAVRTSPSGLSLGGKAFLKSAVKIDCIIGGNGETFSKVKAYEAKRAVRAGARELTLILTPSLIVNSRYGELRKEIRRVRRAAGKALLKARIERVYPQATLSRLARLCSELGVAYFSMPYSSGCERITSELSGGCLLELSGVETLSLYKQTVGAGTRRIVTMRAWEIYTEWLEEVEKITLEHHPAPLLLPPSGGDVEKERETGERKESTEAEEGGREEKAQ